MKRLMKSTVVCLALAAFLDTAYGGIASMDVTVFDAAEKVVFKKSVPADTAFATGNLRAGNYVVQFGSKKAAVKGNQYLLVISAGKKKVIADAVAGEQFAGGGVAMKVQVESSGLQITGQVANEQSTFAKSVAKVRVIDGKRYVWVPGRVGTNLGPHWELESLAPATNVSYLTSDTMRKLQDRAFEGSMLDRYSTGHPAEVHVHGSGGY